jgi:hypothetical protein
MWQFFFSIVNPTTIFPLLFPTHKTMGKLKMVLHFLLQFNKRNLKVESQKIGKQFKPNIYIELGRDGQKRFLKEFEQNSFFTPKHFIKRKKNR